MVDDNEDVKPEFVDIVKVSATGDVAAHQSGSSPVVHILCLFRSLLTYVH